MKTGLQLIKEERQEQITKHGFSLEKDAKYYQSKELEQAARYCLMLCDFKEYKGLNIFWPEGWSRYFENKVLNKTIIGKLIVAGAFLMAENERRKDKFHKETITLIATKINRLLKSKP